MSARQEPPDPETDHLRRAVEEIPGVARVEVRGEDLARPIVRVHLDGTGDHETVLDNVRSAISRWRSPTPRPNGRRAGLGKGLDVLLSEAQSPPHQGSRPSPRATGERFLQRIAVVRGVNGDTVQATDSQGTMSVVFVADGDADGGVVAAVATLLDVALSEVLGVATTMFGTHPVTTVVVADVDGVVRTGAAPAGSDLMLAIGEAAWRALDG